MDPHGAVVVGAQITAVNTLTKEKTEAITDAQGRYVLENVLAGGYTVTVSAKGFASAAKELRVTEANSTFDFQLSIDEVGETVTVTETARAELERTPGGVVVVTERELTQSLSSNLKDVFTFTPGVLAQSRSGSDEVAILHPRLWAQEQLPRARRQFPD